jgi:flagellar hook assembly protein FlgD
VRELVNGQVDPARHVVYWDGKDESGVPVSSGIYFVTMYARSIEEQGKEFTMTRKMILLK